ncbi:hypothetical protein [uncultured Comamonas sp.]|uniref:hypothetical protein n=1 Tax=uncultured Comamonas sp. TaxID=114710 RepID=UPI0025FA7FF0|nr:hypothetical protein [uncultured Comamonas sp.]
MIRLHRRHLLAHLCTAALATVALAHLPALAASAGGERGHKAAKKHGNKIKIQNSRSSSEETTAERDRRLYRECQGRPNSGACAGYAYTSSGRRR